VSEVLSKINAQVEKESQIISTLLNEAGKMIVGQRYILERLLIGVLAEGHVLLEGVPGLAKTLIVKSLADVSGVSFKRIQFTPDLLPSDIVGTMIYNQAKQEFTPKLGPVFSNFVLADEINRAPAKVQSALLEAMQEKQVTIGENTYALEEPFLVLATQNPIDQQGTYALPEAQVDRFMMKIKVEYPSKDEEKLVIKRMTEAKLPALTKVISASDILRARTVVSAIYFDEKVLDYVLDIVMATREPAKYNLAHLEELITHGASPRASIALIKAARAHAFIQGRGFVTPEDVKAIGKDVLRHRIIPSFEAEAENVTSDMMVDQIFSEVEVP